MMTRRAVLSKLSKNSTLVKVILTDIILMAGVSFAGLAILLKFRSNPCRPGFRLGALHRGKLDSNLTGAKSGLVQTRLNNVDFKRSYGLLREMFERHLTGTYERCGTTWKPDSSIFSEVCLDGIPAGRSDPCITYSFGINFDFSFEDELSEKLNCTIRTFDPTMNISSHQRSERVWFYDVGLGSRNYWTRTGTVVATFGTILEEFKEHSHNLAIVKLDIDHFDQWTSSGTILACDEIANVNMILLRTTVAHVGNKNDKTSLIARWRLVDHLERIGFRKRLLTEIPNRRRYRRHQRNHHDTRFELTYMK